MCAESAPIPQACNRCVPSLLASRELLGWVAGADTGSNKGDLALGRLRLREFRNFLKVMWRRRMSSEACIACVCIGSIRVAPHEHLCTCCVFTFLSIGASRCGSGQDFLWCPCHFILYLLLATLGMSLGTAHLSFTLVSQGLAQCLADTEEVTGICCALSQGQSQSKGYWVS